MCQECARRVFLDHWRGCRWSVITVLSARYGIHGKLIKLLLIETVNLPGHTHGRFGFPIVSCITASVAKIIVKVSSLDEMVVSGFEGVEAMHSMQPTLIAIWRFSLPPTFGGRWTRYWRLRCRADLSRCDRPGVVVCTVCAGAQTQRARAEGITSRFVPLAPIACLRNTRS